MMLAMANVMIKAGTYNTSFVSSFVSGFTEWSNYVLGVSDGVCNGFTEDEIRG